MELESYGPIDRLFDVFPPAATPVEVPQVEVPIETSGFKFTGGHFAVAIVLGAAGFVIWNVRRSKKTKRNLDSVSIAS